jgi:hypothetical protein
LPDGAATIVHVSDVAVAAITLHEPDVPIITVFELTVVLKPVPVIVNVILLCETADTVGV